MGTRLEKLGDSLGQQQVLQIFATMPANEGIGRDQ
jgi:hypothetical protein